MCKCRVSDWKVKRIFEKASVSRAVRLRECPLAESWLYEIIDTWSTDNNPQFSSRVTQNPYTALRGFFWNAVITLIKPLKTLPVVFKREGLPYAHMKRFSGTARQQWFHAVKWGAGRFNLWPKLLNALSRERGELPWKSYGVLVGFFESDP